MKLAFKLYDLDDSHVLAFRSRALLLAHSTRKRS